MGAIQSIFFKPARGYKKYTYSDTGVITGKLDTLYQLDGVIREQHTSIARVTKHPVEYGVDLTDHVIKQPMKVVVEGIVTNSPFGKQLLNRLPGDPQTAGNKAEAVLKGERARNAYAGLVELQNERLPISLQTGLLQYENMVLTNIAAPNDVQNNLRVTLTFEEIFIADGSTTGAIQGVTTTPTQEDYLSAGVAMAGIGVNLVGLSVALN